MNGYECESCKRSFNSEEGLHQHNKDKHGVGGVQSKREMKHLKKQEKERQENMERKKRQYGQLVKRGVFIATPVVVIISAIVYFTSQSVTDSSNRVSFDDIPKTAIHWHPKLEIFIKGQEVPIPMNLGASGSTHFPVHTHTETDGTLHYEVNNPTSENMPLRYFFERVWRKPFNSTCILDYCNDEEGVMRMYVNGGENFDFDGYIPRDGDIIRIEFE